MLALPVWVKIRSFLRNITSSGGKDMDLDQEVRSHLEMLTEENIREGMSPDEAQRAARIELGGIEQVKEQVREERIGNWTRSVLSDCRHGLRRLRNSPGFTAAVVLPLAFGIGATMAVFSAVFAVVINPYPYSGADRMVRLTIEDKAGVSNLVFLTGSQFAQLRQTKSVESALGQADWELATTGADLPEDVRAVFLTPNATNEFWIRMALGARRSDLMRAVFASIIVSVSVGLIRSCFWASCCYWLVAPR